MKEKNRHFFSLGNPWITFLLLALLVLFVIGVIRMYGKNRRTHQSRETVAQEIKELTNQKQGLVQDISELSTDRGVEETLRDQYHVKREGEQQIVIIENEPEIPEDSGQSWFSKLFH